MPLRVQTLLEKILMIHSSGIVIQWYSYWESRGKEGVEREREGAISEAKEVNIITAHFI